MTSELPRVSVIIPTYNRCAWLPMAVDSVLAQTYPHIEVIVVDDGSRDGTAAVVAQYGERVTYLRQANQGVAVARNTGFRASCGEYVSFLDDDDFILPDKIERQVQVLDSEPEIGLVHCGYYHADENGELVERMGFLPAGKVLKELACRNFVWVGAPLIRRQYLEAVGLFDEETPPISADWDMWLRIALAGYTFACVQEPLGAYRIRSGSMLADVATLEYATFTILGRLFANPGLPHDVFAAKERAYGEWHLWISCRYYASGCWDDARRNLQEALTLRPQLLKRPSDFLHLLCCEASSPYVSDPFQFVTDVFDHLPDVAHGLNRYRSHMMGKMGVWLALRHYGRGDMAAARRELTRAIALDPVLLEQTQDFAYSLFHHAMCLPVSDPLVYVETVLQNLPASARPLARVRTRVLSDVSVGWAFQDYFAGRHRSVVRRVLTALRHSPSWLGNRGVVSILLRSLPKLLRGGGQVSRLPTRAN